jgi:hypothetical protein
MVLGEALSIDDESQAARLARERIILAHVQMVLDYVPE